MILGGAYYIPFLWTSTPLETITGTAAVTLGNFTALAYGNDGSSLPPGLRLSQALATSLSDSLSIG